MDFATCDNLTDLKIPKSVPYIGDEAFCDIDYNYLPLIVSRGSYAEHYCVENGFEFTYSD